MIKNIIVRKEEIDWLGIINLVFKRKAWGKIYTLYTCDSTTITCIMREFNFEDQTAWFSIKVEYLDDKIIYYKTDLVRYVINHFSIEDFKMHITKKLISLLSGALVDRARTKGKGEYSSLHTYSWDIKEKHIIEAGYADDLEYISSLNESLRSDCMEVLNDKTEEIINAEFNSKVEEYVQNNPFKNIGMESILDDLRKKEAKKC